MIELSKSVDPWRIECEGELTELSPLHVII